MSKTVLNSDELQQSLLAELRAMGDDGDGIVIVPSHDDPIANWDTKGVIRSGKTGADNLKADEVVSRYRKRYDVAWPTDR